MAKKKKVQPPELPQPREDLRVPETYEDYFLQYASYVITDRAIPDLADGLKPVQRRILHSLYENEDGRYNKVANIVGHSMKYHPHGDASIYAALVGMGQRGLLIDPQGNWGDPVTNDPAAAARYIEARLTPFAKEVVFAPHLTEYQRSYDGRNKEPVTLPVRFPLLLATGTEGIAVGLSTRIMPHNFIELLEAQKACLRGEDFEVYPDFPTGGLADVSGYQDGAPGSRVRVRARIEEGPGKTVIIREIPFGTTTESLIDSILAANDKGRIKVSKIDDNTAAEVEIVVTFQRGYDMDKAVDALYAFTDCETSLTSFCNVIHKGRPRTMTVSDMLVENAEQTRALLRRDLEVQRQRLEDRWHQKSLVQIFVENRIYLRIEKCETWESVLEEIDKGLDPHKDKLRRAVTRDDLEMLTEVKIRRISAWDAEKAREELEAIDRELKKVARHLRNVTQYTIDYFNDLLEKFGEGRQRRTTLQSFETVQAVEVVERLEKLYVDRKGGFVGIDMKGQEEVGPCAKLDDAMAVLEDGSLVVTKVAAKKYVGEKILYVRVFTPEDKEKVFNMVYHDLKSGNTYLKRFTIGGVTRDRTYPLGKSKKAKVLYFAPDDESRYVFVKLKKKPRIKTELYEDFEEYLVKGRGAAGNIITKHAPLRAEEITERVYCNRTGADPEELAELAEDDEEDDGAGDSSPGASKGKEKTSDDSSEPPSKDQKNLFD
ncbi:MAG TPA: DNA gyrase/topoisomerase IV subunit A [Acidobacteriota bacterium]|nr:DNA gyrase/topoisomerase IV subunit A [Acidobacteriota bacterium]